MPIGAARRIGWFGWLIVVAALVVRLYYISAAEVDTPLRADAGQYFRIAYNVTHSLTFSTAIPDPAGVTPDSYRAPGYPALIAVLLLLLGDLQNAYWAVLILQCLLGAATVGLSLCLALRVMPRPWAYASAILTALWPHLITLSGYVLTETTFGFLVALSAWCLVLLLERRTQGVLISAGASLAAAALVNQVILAFSVPLAVWYVASRRSRGALLFAALALVPPALWGLRDARMQAVPGNSASGRLMENVLIGMEPDYIPRYKITADEPQAAAAWQRITDGLHAYAVNPRQELADIGGRLASEPGKYLLWYASKPAQFWTWSIVQGYGDVYVYDMVVAPFDEQPLLRIVAALCHGMNGMLMWAAFAGVIVFALRRKRATREFVCAAWVIASLFIFATLVHTVLTPDARYAVPFRPFEIILAITAVSAATGWALGLRRPGLGEAEVSRRDAEALPEQEQSAVSPEPAAHQA
jgi:4-amino-4-deoxy-L-arabinose transferase-like glycosyltransferase